MPGGVEEGYYYEASGRSVSEERSGYDFRSLLPTRSPQASGGAEDDDDLCSWLPEMTWRERILGCATCVIAGYLLSFGSFFRIKDLLLGDPFPFVLNATAGNIIALAGSCFLSGPRSQLDKMWHETRRGATQLYLGSLALTLLIAFLPLPGPKGFVLVLLMICQYLAITWYTLSYIPYAREAIANYMQRRLGGGV